MNSDTCIRNTDFPRRRTRSVALAAALTLGFGLAGLVHDDPFEAVTGAWLSVFFVLPLVFVPRRTGALFAQPFVCCDERGLRYGEALHVPGSDLVAVVRVRRLRTTEDRILTTVPMTGSLTRRIETARGLPLSALDPDWRSNDTFVTNLRRFVHIEPEPPGRGRAETLRRIRRRSDSRDGS